MARRSNAASRAHVKQSPADGIEGMAHCIYYRKNSSKKCDRWEVRESIPSIAFLCPPGQFDLMAWTLPRSCPPYPKMR